VTSGSDSHNPKKGCSSIAPFAQVNDDRQSTGAESSQDGIGANVNYCSQSTKGAKRTWEASLSSLKSKRVKGGQLVGYQSGSSCGFILETDEANSCFVEALHDPSIIDGSEKCVENCLHLEAPINIEPPSTKQCFRIMLMNIADDAKKTQLTKVCLITQAFCRCFDKLKSNIFLTVLERPRLFLSTVLPFSLPRSIFRCWQEKRV